MAGTIVGAAPWTREAIRQYRHRYPDTFAQMETSIPDGLGVVLTCGRRPGDWGAVLRKAHTDRELVRVGTEYRTITAAVGAVVRAGEAIGA